jgi:hypothetical protein
MQYKTSDVMTRQGKVGDKMRKVIWNAYFLGHPLVW